MIKACLLRALRSHIKNCRELHQLLERGGPRDLCSLYWYDLPLRTAVSFGGMFKVILWNLRPSHPIDEAARNHGVPTVYFAMTNKSCATKSTPTVWNYSGLSTVPWRDDVKRSITLLEQAAPIIAAEYKSVREYMTSHPDGVRLLSGGQWRTLFLFNERGARNEVFSTLCPMTMRTIELLPVCRTFGFAMFSELCGGTRIMPHSGSTNLRLRLHLGVSVPEPSKTIMRVGEEERHWEELKCFAFDDSFEHEAINRGTKSRVILSVDIWQPKILASELALLEAPIFHSFGKINNFIMP